MEKKQRLYCFDFLKFIAIFCVCYGHCIQHFISGVPSENVIFRIIYSFHMPLFMAITGYFCYMGTNISLWHVTKKKLRQLILPGTAFAVAISLLTGFGSGFHILGLLCPYWFLQSAFICAMLYYTTIFLTPRKYLWGGDFMLSVNKSGDIGGQCFSFISCFYNRSRDTSVLVQYL